jgi:hypothetical protein
VFMTSLERCCDGVSDGVSDSNEKVTSTSEATN